MDVAAERIWSCSGVWSVNVYHSHGVPYVLEWGAGEGTVINYIKIHPWLTTSVYSCWFGNIVLCGYMILSRTFCHLYFSDRRLLQPAQVCDILKGVILVICYFMMHYVDYSMMYHLIRGQSVIKLYIIYNMLEVRILASGYQACFFQTI